MTHPPSLTALRAFHAVGRQGSVGRAAQTLNVTHSAVSHQVRRLEEELDCKLLERSGSGAELTQAGRELMRQIGPAFEILDNLQFSAPEDNEPRVLRIACAPGLLSRIATMLDRFLVHSSAISLRLLPLSEAREDEVDLIITFGDSRFEGSRLAMLGNIQYFPVCSPRLLNQGEPLRRPRDLAKHVLIHELSRTDWSRYFLAAGLSGLTSAKNLYLPDAYLTLHAAINGVGIAISDTILAGGALQRGQLVRLFDVEVPAPHPYFIITPARRESPLAWAFVEWLQREIDVLSNRNTAFNLPSPRFIDHGPD
ncbi:LysR substrate-binding domain-containing protein [Nitratireductor alexandrii]|uniref:LysR substrate-binding domain-containing protein n=1 Tax=Nitratireductor alexandrii TaxID=2448161 RepID=UPI000FDB1174|nr:LysR substrate-binding domain-containing protein [Nitratireductor alexandrii]